MRNIYAAKLLAQGPFYSPPPGDPVQTLVGNDLIVLPINGIHKRLNAAGAITGVTMPLGSSTMDGQHVRLINLSASTITFAASGSNVSLGSAIVIAAGKQSFLVWDNTSGLWYT